MPVSDATDTPRDLSPRGRSIAVVAWSGFLAAAVGTLVCFACLDPEALRDGAAPAWWTDRITVYSIGFAFLLIVASAAATIAVYLVRTEHRS